MEVTRQTPVRRLRTSGENGIDEDLDKIEVQAERVQYRGECGTNIIKGKAEKKACDDDWKTFTLAMLMLSSRY